METIESNLVSVQAVPEEYRSVFTEFPYFNKIQSAVFKDVLHSDQPIVLAAPTGSGKTVIFELAIIRLLKQIDSFANPLLSKVKIIYVAPMKAICEERHIDWYKKFNNFGLKCASITGDSAESFMDVMNYNIIVTTPEKWDTLTRKWRDCKKLVSCITLFMIDEIHLLNEESRGATLESIVCRMKTIQSSQYGEGSDPFLNGIRFIAVSATIPNIADIAKWIGSVNNEAIYHSFNENMRPVKLNKIVIGYNMHDKNAFKFDIMLNYKLQNILMQYSEGKPTLIFCSTRKSVEMTSKYIALNITIEMTLDQKAVLTRATNNIIDAKSKQYLIHGVGYHHAGMLLECRKIIEDLFKNGDLPVLVTTSTLAMGVNLPAHLVIIKSTKFFANGEYKDYNESTVLQMIGRAGRPQFDTSATAVILTTTNERMKYENMVDRGHPIESNLHRHLTEHLNAEICLKTITDLGIALQWISSSFLYIRAKKSPRHYGLPAGLTNSQLDAKLLEMCKIDIDKLKSGGMIIMNETASLIPTHLGQLMAQYYMAFETMIVFTSVKGDEALSQILGLLCRSREFADLFLRSSDKKTLNILNKNKSSECIRFPFNSRITTVEMKVNCIIQAVFGSLLIVEHSLLNEATKIIRIGSRLAICLTKYMETRTKCFSALLNTYILAKCFQARLWENSNFVARQLADIGNVRSKLLVDAAKTSFKSILDSNPRDLERIMKRKSPFGDRIREKIISFPFYEMSLTKDFSEKIISLKITLTNPETCANNDGVMILLVGDDVNNILIHEKYTHEYMKDNIIIERTASYNDNTVHVSANFISEDKVGLDCVVVLQINPQPDLLPIEETEAKSKTSKKKIVDKNNNTARKPINKTSELIKFRINQKKLDQTTLNNFFPVIKNTQNDVSTQKDANKNTSSNKENNEPIPSTSKTAETTQSNSIFKKFGNHPQKANNSNKKPGKPNASKATETVESISEIQKYLKSSNTRKVSLSEIINDNNAVNAHAVFSQDNSTSIVESNIAPDFEETKLSAEDDNMLPLKVIQIINRKFKEKSLAADLKRKAPLKVVAPQQKTPMNSEENSICNQFQSQCKNFDQSETIQKRSIENLEKSLLQKGITTPINDKADSMSSASTAARKNFSYPSTSQSLHITQKSNKIIRPVARAPTHKRIPLTAPEVTLSINPGANLLISNVRKFQATPKRSLSHAEYKRKLPMELFEDFLLTEHSIEVPAKRQTTGEPTIDAPDSTVDNEINLELIEVIEPEGDTNPLGNVNMSRTITWRSPLLLTSPQVKHSPRLERITSNVPKTSQNLPKNSFNLVALKHKRHISEYNLTDKQSGYVKQISSPPYSIQKLIQDHSSDTNNHNNTLNTSFASTVNVAQNRVTDYATHLRTNLDGCRKPAESQKSNNVVAVEQRTEEDLLAGVEEYFLDPMLLEAIAPSENSVHINNDLQSYNNSEQVPKRQQVDQLRQEQNTESQLYESDQNVDGTEQPSYDHIGNDTDEPQLNVSWNIFKSNILSHSEGSLNLAPSPVSIKSVLESSPINCNDDNAQNEYMTQNSFHHNALYQGNSQYVTNHINAPQSVGNDNLPHVNIAFEQNGSHIGRRPSNTQAQNNSQMFVPNGNCRNTSHYFDKPHTISQFSQPMHNSEFPRFTRMNEPVYQNLYSGHSQIYNDSNQMPVHSSQGNIMFGHPTPNYYNTMPMTIPHGRNYQMHMHVNPNTYERPLAHNNCYQSLTAPMMNHHNQYYGQPQNFGTYDQFGNQLPGRFCNSQMFESNRSEAMNGERILPQEIRSQNPFSQQSYRNAFLLENAFENNSFRAENVASSQRAENSGMNTALLHPDEIKGKEMVFKRFMRSLDEFPDY